MLMFTVHSIIGQDPCERLNYHAFKAESLAGTYTDLNMLGTEIFTPSLDDGNSEPQEIGFVFEYHCEPFTQFIFNTNGFIKLGVETIPKTNLFFDNAQSTNGGIFNNPDSNNVNLIVVLNHDIEGGVGEPEFRVHTSGTAPYRVCTIQWENMREWSNDSTSKQYDNMDFQLKLYETTNVIEFVYGDWDPSTNTSNFKTGACGLKGNSNADDQLLVVVKFSAAYWGNVVFHDGNYAPNESFSFGNPTDRPKPDRGRTYRFTPTYYNDLSVQQVYTLGNASSYYSLPQNISANIKNLGFTALSNIPVILDITGSNTFRDTQYIAALAFGENKRVAFSTFESGINGQNDIKVYVADDDNTADNARSLVQQTTDFQVSYATQEPSFLKFGFLSGEQGIYYAKYPVHGTTSVNAVNVYLANDTPSIGKTVFAVVLRADGTLAARSENYTIQESDFGGWHTFSFSTPFVLTNTEFYAGFGMTSSLTEYSPLGVQDEIPLRPGAYYTSFITGNGLIAMDTNSFAFRFMIGATLAGAVPFAGFAFGDTSICAYGIAHLVLEESSGFITWQSSADGVGGWQDVLDGSGATTENFTTTALSASTFYRAKIFQPGFGEVYSNVVYVEVIPSLPIVTISGDYLHSSAETGNQWYDENGPIEAAIGQDFLALKPGTYYVVVTIGDCVSAPSNAIELLTVATHELLSDFGIRIYPNPVRDILTIEMPGNVIPMKFEIINVLGQIVFSSEMNEKTIIEMTGCNAGLYFIRFHSGTFSELRKLVRE
jgi:hypothetical protein